MITKELYQEFDKFARVVIHTLQSFESFLRNEHDLYENHKGIYELFPTEIGIGCRVSDLYKFTNQNVIRKAIEYVPQKTKEERPLIVRVPLNDLAQEILKKYKDEKRTKIFPFISEQKYNNAIKEMFLEAGLTRPVTIINSVTSEPEVKPLNEIASSHLARRTFVGNLYKQVKDPNLVGSLSGHKEGSKAFARYRDIDEDMKKDLVKLLE